MIRIFPRKELKRMQGMEELVMPGRLADVTVIEINRVVRNDGL